MSDIIKVGEIGRAFYALFNDVSNISVCKMYLKKISSGTEEELDPVTSFSGELDGETVEGFKYIFEDGDFVTAGNYSIETYIEMNDGYKGRRENKVIEVEEDHSVSPF